MKTTMLIACLLLWIGVQAQQDTTRLHTASAAGQTAVMMRVISIPLFAIGATKNNEPLLIAGCAAQFISILCEWSAWAHVKPKPIRPKKVYKDYDY